MFSDNIEGTTPADCLFTDLFETSAFDASKIDLLDMDFINAQFNSSCSQKDYPINLDDAFPACG